MKQKVLYVAALMLLSSSFGMAKKKVEDPEITKLKAKIENVMSQVDKHPDWLYSRLQMFWKTQASDVFVNGETFSHPGGAKAAGPTVKYNGSRSTASQYNRPKLEDIIPYDDDEQGSVTYISRATGKMEKTSPAKTGCNLAGVNHQIITIARDAARIYAATGDMRYGQMAAKVFDVYMKGIAYRNVPIDLNHGHQQTLVGMTTFEVIHEDVINELTQMYPLIKNLVKDDQAIIESGFKKWAENIIANGVPHNNWDLFQADFIMKIALVLQDNQAYADGKGKQYYLDYIVNQNSIRQWSMNKLIDFGFDAKSKTWYEAPGYSTTVLGSICDFANMLDEKAGIDLFKQRPILKEAVKTSAEYLFPNRMIAGFGDTHPGYLNIGGIDHILKYATRHKDKNLISEMNLLKNAVTSKAPISEIEKYTSTLFYAPNVSWIAMRSGMDKQHDLMASINASLGNHQHANGISLELYGKGYVLGPDAGIGRSLYSGLDYLEYYSQMPAHNTVVVDGVSSYPVMMSQHAFKVVASYPEVSKEQPASKKLSEQKEKVSYATVSFIEPEAQALQQRTTAIVKTSDKGGYYIDVFRSRKKEGGDKTHDYFYHNLGQEMKVMDAISGQPLDMKPTEELAFAGGHLYAYSYIYDKKSAEMQNSIKTQFVTKIQDDKVVEAMDGQREITMTMWMKKDENRTIFQALSPVNLEYERMPNQPYKVDEQPVLTFVARQKGEAWNHPFVCVYEPSSDTEPGDIASVDYFTPSEPSAVGIIVKLKDGTEQSIVCSENGKVQIK
ncbi:heparinase II/III family protein [Prevotella copri]|uniref:Heparinase II/III family protein n=1 Tax=Segatella copri TaxID=165179 RepID=A0AAP3BDJ0_9BACT|nr:heparinase II/III family protein [Segatella copri]MCW4128673.1 heparinase II/III family protein [Segatella copri]MCW4414935.1 heparinase II/III family protein [Segatella copri]MCW4421937.1 heparinase II/III family protein [Segatella copri]